MKKKMVAMLLGLALAASTLGGCGEATASEVVETEAEAEETEEASDEVEAEAEAEKAETEEVETEEESEAEAEIEAEDIEAESEVEEVSDESTEEITEETTTETTEVEVVYTYSEATATMYAKQSVNVRDLPSTSGNRVGGLSTNQEVSVTGQCNETGWYRISYNDTDAYVSNNYLVSEKVAVQTTSNTTQDTTTTTTQTETQQTTETTSTTTQVSTQTTQSTSSSLYDSLPQTFTDLDAACNLYNSLCNQGYGKSVTIDFNADGTYTVTYWDGVSGGGSTSTTTTTTTTTTTQSSGYSTECVGYINDLRASVGVSSLTWSDSLAEVALARAQELADAGALDGHAGLSKYGSYGENLYWGSSTSASSAYNAWYNSEGHYNNMVNSGYTYVAVAYVGNYWVTIFQR